MLQVISMHAAEGMSGCGDVPVAGEGVVALLLVVIFSLVLVLGGSGSVLLVIQVVVIIMIPIPTARRAKKATTAMHIF